MKHAWGKTAGRLLVAAVAASIGEGAAVADDSAATPSSSLCAGVVERCGDSRRAECVTVAEWLASRRTGEFLLRRAAECVAAAKSCGRAADCMYDGAMRWAPGDAAAEGAPAGLRARLLVARARKAMRAHDRDGAVATYEQAAALDGKLVGGLCEAAIAKAGSSAKDASEQASAHLAQLLASDPENATAAWLLTRWAAPPAMRQAAVDYWQRRTESGNTAEVHQVLARLARQAGDIDAMLEHANASLAARPALDRAWLLYRLVGGALNGWAWRARRDGPDEVRRRASRAIEFLEGSAKLAQVDNTEHRLSVAAALASLYLLRGRFAAGPDQAADYAKSDAYHDAYRALFEKLAAEVKR